MVSSSVVKVTQIIVIVEAMENFVFPDEIKTKLMKMYGFMKMYELMKMHELMKMYELINIFPILTEVPQKSC